MHWFESVLLALFLGAAAMPLWSLYQHVSVIWLVALSVLAGLTISTMARIWKWSGTRVMLVSLGVMLLLSVPLGVPTRSISGVLPSWDGAREFILAAVSGWKQIVTVDPPLGNYRGVLVPAFLVSYICASAAFWLLNRAGRGWAVLPVAVLYIFAIACGPEASSTAVLSGLLVIGIGLAWATLRTLGMMSPSGAGEGKSTTRPRRGRVADHFRRGLAAVIVVGVAGVTGGLVSGAIEPRLDRDVIRSHVKVPFDPKEYVSPMVAYRNSVTVPEKTQVQFEIEGATAGTRIRLATLDDYDGQVFSSASGTSETAGVAGAYQQVPLRLNDVSPGKSVSVRITIDDLTGVWLPLVGTPETVSFAEESTREQFYYNRVANAGVLRQGVSKGLTYTVRAVLPGTLSDDSIAGIVPGDAAQAELPVVPEALEKAAAAQYSAEDPPAERLLAVARWLRTGYVSHSGDGEPFSRPGHSAGRLNLLVDESPMLGDAEQYATAFAVLARGLGFPARVVVGYEVNGPKVVGADLTAWAEVQRFDGKWVGIDPVPETREIPPAEEKPLEAQPQPETVLPPPAVIKEDPLDSRTTDDDAAPEGEIPAWIQMLLAIWGVSWPILLVLSILSLPLWGLMLVAALRRRYRYRQDRAHRSVAGAWAEVRDMLVDRGSVVPATHTRLETVSEWGMVEPGVSPEAKARVLTLAERANAADFARHVADAEEVESYWKDLRAGAKLVMAKDGRRSRLVRLLRARSIRRSASTGWMKLTTYRFPRKDDH
ncbi:hypothetical protein M2390_001866 [Mycetocola sp. BIGb0189]|uniref:DUF3488 and transglutaminase-like domain-containing protein n=1 Tax=Mycetocola sp. BIGb0189 TaxID=2940604 RepID=UPI002167DF1B|nr:transglutaminase domain-containing protein [Mycetocola sp. BIGb0189]MCS4276672.1 hypothetical protein [Mycetocola sp. BIGb0189]